MEDEAGQEVVATRINTANDPDEDGWKHKEAPEEETEDQKKRA